MLSCACTLPHLGLEEERIKQLMMVSLTEQKGGMNQSTAHGSSFGLNTGLNMAGCGLPSNLMQVCAWPDCLPRCYLRQNVCKLMSGFESRNQQGTSISNSIAGGLGGQLGLQNTSLLQQQLLQAAGAGGGSMNGLHVRTPTPSHFALVPKL